MTRRQAPTGLGWVREIVLDCPDPAATAGFWSHILGGRPVEWYDGWVTLEPPPHGQRFSFQRAADPGGAGVHVDVLVADLEQAHTGVLEAGGRFVSAHWSPRSDEEGDPVPWRVYQDPDGHRFCLVVR